MTVPPNQTRDRFNATMTTNPADAPGFIANVIANLTSGGGVVGSDSFESGLTQDEAGSALEFLQKDNDGNFVFNFAVARVRLKGNTPGAQAVKVRVFFRMFNAATTHSEFNPNTTYRFHSDGVLNGVKVPLLGVQNDQNGQPEYVTIPCFAVPRVNLAGPADMNNQPEDTPNAYTIDVNPGVEVDSFFGCWLDINQPQQKFLAQTPVSGNLDGPFSGTLLSFNEVITKAPHQCLIAEIRFDDTPIPIGANSATSDKIAQRNIAWVDGPNPGVFESRRMPHPFEIRPSSPQASALDELMVLWGNTPNGSQAQFYLPALDAKEIVSLARAVHGSTRLKVVDPHTLQVPVGGATFIPIPRGTARNAGLLTVDLPDGVKRGDIYEISVRQITEDTAHSGGIILLEQAQRDTREDTGSESGGRIQSGHSAGCVSLARSRSRSRSARSSICSSAKSGCMRGCCSFTKPSRRRTAGIPSSDGISIRSRAAFAVSAATPTRSSRRRPATCHTSTPSTSGII